MAVTLSKVGCATAVLGLVSWSGKHWLLADWAHQHFVPKTAFLLVTILAAGGAFYLTASLLRVPEVNALTQTVRRKLRR
jgi:hypothetical protein